MIRDILIALCICAMAAFSGIGVGSSFWPHETVKLRPFIVHEEQVRTVFVDDPRPHEKWLQSQVAATDEGVKFAMNVLSHSNSVRRK